MNPLISICLATYNGQKYLKTQLDSLVSQTYKNMEVVIQDDCSSDETIQIIDSFKDRLNINLFINEHNIGYVKNFEAALKKSNGEYIALCDQDDIWQSDKLQTLVDSIKDSSLIYSDSLLVNEDGVSIGKTLSKKLKNNFIESNNSLNFLFDNSVSAHAMLFSRELLDYIFPFPKHIYFDQWIAANAANLNGIYYIDKSLVHYRQHSENTLGNQTKNSDTVTKKVLNKIDKKRDANSNMLNILKEFRELKVLSSDDKTLIKKLITHYEKFDNTYYNLELFLLLKHNSDTLFKITKKDSLLFLLKKAIGLKLYKALPIL